MGWGKGDYSFSFGPAAARKIRWGFQQAGKKEGGLGEGIFARLLSAEGGMGWESVSAIPASARRQNRKIFVSLIEKNFGSAQVKNVKKIFLFCSPSGERKRWAGLSPVGRQLKINVRIFVKKSSDFNQKAPPFFRIWILGDCCLAPPKAGLGFGKDFERIFEIQKQFLPAQTEVRRAKHG